MKKNKRAKDNAVNMTLIFLPMIIVIVLWQILCDNGAINITLLPSPKTVVETFIKMITDGSLWSHISASLIRIGLGFLVGVLAGVIIGILMGIFPKFDKAMTLFVGILRPIPIIALIPIFILWLGIGEESKITIIILGTFWPVLINTIHGVKSVDKKLLELSRVLKKGNLKTLAHIIIPSAFPMIFTGIRLGAGNSLVCVITAEMIAASQGLGYLIMYARQMSQPAVVLVGIFTIGLVGLLIDTLFKYIEKWMTRG